MFTFNCSWNYYNDHTDFFINIPLTNICLWKSLYFLPTDNFENIFSINLRNLKQRNKKLHGRFNDKQRKNKPSGVLNDKVKILMSFYAIFPSLLSLKVHPHIFIRTN